MKRIFLILLTVAALFLFASCNTTKPDVSNTNTDSTVEIPKPNQEVLFVITRTNFSDDIYFSGSIIDSNGNYHYLPNNFSFEDENWYQIALDAQKSQAANSVKETDLNTIYKFISEFDANESHNTITYDEYIPDYGSITLYEIYSGANSKMAYKKLCQYGESISCLDDETVKDFVNWMTDNNYFFISDFKY